MIVPAEVRLGKENIELAFALSTSQSVLERVPEVSPR
jgi:hypothetical protein